MHTSYSNLRAAYRIYDANAERALNNRAMTASLVTTGVAWAAAASLRHAGFDVPADYVIGTAFAAAAVASQLGISALRSERAEEFATRADLEKRIIAHPEHPPGRAPRPWYQLR